MSNERWKRKKNSSVENQRKFLSILIFSMSSRIFFFRFLTIAFGVVREKVHCRCTQNSLSHETDINLPQYSNKYSYLSWRFFFVLSLVSLHVFFFLYSSFNALPHSRTCFSLVFTCSWKIHNIFLQFTQFQSGYILSLFFFHRRHLRCRRRRVFFFFSASSSSSSYSYSHAMSIKFTPVLPHKHTHTHSFSFFLSHSTVIITIIAHEFAMYTNRSCTGTRRYEFSIFFAWCKVRKIRRAWKSLRLLHYTYKFALVGKKMIRA